MECFGWRTFDNLRQIGALIGTAPTPYQSGDSNRDQGISKAGNPRMRIMAVELAWYWLRYQPGSELARWYERRFAHGSEQQRKIGIVALGRKLLIKLWQYLQTGQPPEGAIVVDWQIKVTGKARPIAACITLARVQRAMAAQIGPKRGRRGRESLLRRLMGQHALREVTACEGGQGARQNGLPTPFLPCFPYRAGSCHPFPGHAAEFRAR